MRFHAGSVARAFIAILLLTGLSQQVLAGPQFVVALEGYDPVSYFTAGQPQKGDLVHGVHWNGATWLFASEENQRRFEQNPAAYAPQFDGYCAYAASQGYKAPGDPQTWKIVDGKLYLNFNADAARLWREDIPGNIHKGEENWPRLNSF
jgi:hypothetical protein